MNAFTIKDLENMSGIKAHTLRIWEQRYGIIKPERSESKIRFYSTEELKLILNVALLNKYGYKISVINEMTEAEINENILALDLPNAQQERVINQLIRLMVDLDVEAMEQVLDTYILSRGIEKTVLQIIFPFLEKIGVLWQTNNINPAHEHLVSNLLRQKLIMGIEGLQPISRVDSTILLFLPEGEHHEMGLLFMHFLLKSRGVKVLYLGCDIPIEDVKYVTDLKKPDYLYTHLTNRANFKFEKLMAQVSGFVPQVPVVISGQIARDYQKKINKPIMLKKSFEESLEFVRTL